MTTMKPETTMVQDGIKVHSLYVGSFPPEMLTRPHVTARRMHKEGFSEDFLHEALEQVQYPLFGRWGLIGEKGGNDTYADRCSVYIFGQYYGRDGLALKTRGLLVLSGLSVLLRDNVAPTWTNACRNLGWTEDQLKELGAMIAHVGGFPVSRGSLMLYDDVFEKRAKLSAQTGVSGQAPATLKGDELYRKGSELALKLFGTPDGEFADLPLPPGDDLRKEMVTWVYGYLFTERSLIPLKDKVLGMIAMHVAAGGREPFVRKWLGAARNVGCSRLEIQEAILMMSLYSGWPVAAQALDLLQQVWPLQA